MKKIILFGAGKYGNSVLRKGNLQKERLLFCDNDIHLQNSEIEGIKVIHFKRMKELYEQDKIDKIIVTPQRADFIDAIVFQCIAGNIDKNDLYYYSTESGALKNIWEKPNYKIYSHDGEEVYLRQRFYGRETGRYIDVGANHPFRWSNTYWAYKQGWRRINIEPNCNNYRLLNYFRNEDINLNCGIGSEETELDYYEFSDSALNTFCCEEVNEVKDEVLNVKKVPVRRLDSVCRQYGFKKVDYIDIDVEGMEMQVLDSIDWSETLFECILVEQRRMTLSDVLVSDVCQFLMSKGYHPISKYNRTVIYERKENK
ncbi:FkbM family methyltransferase [bacterium C-53]|nr:FkbM family methyltransferase [Lachnospiraceae bacterium]NBI04692.1 FkbM family methyltransferase [Lachnospiraceae bacterium]RKJ07914.1 FkbM family methyltransferase [bacterium C-53]